MTSNPFSTFVLENWRVTLKLSAMGISGALGVVAMLNDFKDKDGRLTRWGRVNLAGLVLASLVGVVIEVADTREENKKAKAAEAAANEQIQQSVMTNRNLIAVLQTSLQVQTGVGNTLKEQSRILGANQQTFREVERGFTPLGSHVMMDYKLSLPGDDVRFAGLQNLLKTEFDKAQANRSAESKAEINSGVRVRHRGDSLPSSFAGLEIQTNFSPNITGARIAVDSPALVAIGGWPRETMADAPLHLKVWKQRTVLSRCKVSADPDAEFAAHRPASTWGQAGAESRQQDDLEAATDLQPIVNLFDVATKTLVQTGSVKLGQRISDDGTIQSPLDLEGALVDVMMAGVTVGRIPDDFGTLFSFKELTLYAGHYTIHLDPDHPAARCGSDIYFVLPSHLSAPR